MVGAVVVGGVHGVRDDAVVGDGGVVAGQGRLGVGFDDRAVQVRADELPDRLQGVPDGEHLQLDGFSIIFEKRLNSLD
jgi:hypothetical protein